MLISFVWTLRMRPIAIRYVLTMGYKRTQWLLQDSSRTIHHLPDIMLPLLVLCFASVGVAQFPPVPKGLTTKNVEDVPGVKISFKETHICETQAKAWAGYVHMPASTLQDVQNSSDPYNISMFFWYFQSRNDPRNSPTTIYLAGGPGESSLFAATAPGGESIIPKAHHTHLHFGSGPCLVGSDSNSTTPNPWSMNAYSNVLYVDQPVGAGYSYDELLKSTSDLMYLNDDPKFTGNVPFKQYHGEHNIPAENTTFKYGILPSSDPLHTVNTTGLAARTLWHFSQAWFGAFPEWQTCDKRVSLWGNCMFASSIRLPM